MAREYDLETRRCVLLGQVKRVLRSRLRGGYELPDDDAGREYLELVLRLSADKNMRATAENRAPWMNGESDEMIANIQRMPPSLRLPTGKQLGEMLRLTNEERAHHQVWQILPCDISKEELAEWRKARDRQRKRAARAGAKPRAEYESKSLSKLKPWLAEVPPISRAQWYRRRQRQ